jgi:hypothetical protein
MPGLTERGFETSEAAERYALREAEGDRGRIHFCLGGRGF